MNIIAIVKPILKDTGEATKVSDDFVVVEGLCPFVRTRNEVPLERVHEAGLILCRRDDCHVFS
jgi:hypothetical protein